MIYNIGAFNQTDPTGWRAAIIAGGTILLISLPLLLSLSVTTRLSRATDGMPAAESTTTS